MDVVGRDGCKLGQQRGAEVEVRRVRLPGELADGRAVLGVELVARRALPVRGAGALAAGLRCRPLAQLLDGALDRLLGKLPVQRPVGDDRRAAIELDQDARGACLIDIGWVEADRRRPVGVLLDPLMQLLGLGEERVGLLAQPQPRRSRWSTVFRYAANVSLPVVRRAWPIAQPALLTSCDPATAPASIVATTASASPGETSLMTSSVSIALTGISPVPTSACP
ncbi:MAG TPA: hypothetical protein VHZ31_03920, partial [Solirubrobacteraceae bacterium]|nr:hypothetical protein [Solirubrobacteraceae bacterium]